LSKRFLNAKLSPKKQTQQAHDVRMTSLGRCYDVNAKQFVNRLINIFFWSRCKYPNTLRVKISENCASQFMGVK